MDDPSGRIPRNLVKSTYGPIMKCINDLQLPHIHLVSSHRYPLQPNLPLGTVVDYLIDAPRITRHVAPMSWQFLDAPSDGTVQLEWQPLSRLGTHAATDGYVWAGPEAPFTTQVRGYVRGDPE